MGEIRKDILLILGIVLAAFLLWLVPVLLHRGSDKGGRVRVFQDGKEMGAYMVSEDQEVLLPYGEAHYNLLVIRDGKVSVAEADCPDKLCVRQREISRNGESIICLPHKLVIQIESEKEGAPDAVTY